MRKSIILAAALLAFGSMAATADPLQDGAHYFTRPTISAHWPPGVRWPVRAIPVAQNNLGIMYLDGKGVPQNTSEAVRYLCCPLRRLLFGQNNLGGLYRDGKGVPRDYGKAAQWFAASAGQGNSAGMYIWACV